MLFWPLSPHAKQTHSPLPKFSQNGYLRIGDRIPSLRHTFLMARMTMKTVLFSCNTRMDFPPKMTTHSLRNPPSLKNQVSMPRDLHSPRFQGAPHLSEVHALLLARALLCPYSIYPLPKGLVL